MQDEEEKERVKGGGTVEAYLIVSSLHIAHLIGSVCDGIAAAGRGGGIGVYLVGGVAGAVAVGVQSVAHVGGAVGVLFFVM